MRMGIISSAAANNLARSFGCHSQASTTPRSLVTTHRITTPSASTHHGNQFQLLSQIKDSTLEQKICSGLLCFKKWQRGAAVENVLIRPGIVTDSLGHTSDSVPER